jgi:Protein of unknown function (DUF2946)
VPTLRRSQWLRPCMSMLAAYALVLQIALSGVLASRSIAADSLSPDSQISICHGSGSGGDDQPGDAGKPRDGMTHCALCVLASGSPAALASGYASAVVLSAAVSNVLPGADDRIDAYHSPTGQYQRGPPARLSAVG